MSKRTWSLRVEPFRATNQSGESCCWVSGRVGVHATNTEFTLVLVSHTKPQYDRGMHKICSSDLWLWVEAEWMCCSQAWRISWSGVMKWRAFSPFLILLPILSLCRFICSHWVGRRKIRDTIIAGAFFSFFDGGKIILHPAHTIFCQLFHTDERMTPWKKYLLYYGRQVRLAEIFLFGDCMWCIKLGNHFEWHGPICSWKDEKNCISLCIKIDMLSWCFNEWECLETSCFALCEGPVSRNKWLTYKQSVIKLNVDHFFMFCTNTQLQVDRIQYSLHSSFPPCSIKETNEWLTQREIHRYTVTDATCQMKSYIFCRPHTPTHLLHTNIGRPLPS